MQSIYITRRTGTGVGLCVSNVGAARAATISRGTYHVREVCARESCFTCVANYQVHACGWRPVSSAAFGGGVDGATVGTSPVQWPAQICSAWCAGPGKSHADGGDGALATGSGAWKREACI